MESCKNHPSVESITNCVRCNVPMCGLCGNYIEAASYCEGCVALHESEQIASTRSRQLEHEANREQEEKTSILHPKPVKDSGSSSSWTPARFLVVSIIGVFALMLLFSSTIFMSSQDRAKEAAVEALEDCRLIFEEIGTLLFNNQIPDPSLRCEEALSPNIITREGDTIRVSHPNPGYIGYSEIFVTNTSRVPMFIE